MDDATTRSRLAAPLAEADATREAAALLGGDTFRRVADFIRDDHDRIVEDIVRITQIPSPPFGEAERGRAYAEMLRAHGLTEVETDAEGNVTGLRPGTDPAAGLVAVCSHLDTVFPAGTDVTVRREGTKLMAPGVGDNSRSLAVLLAFVRALDAAGVRTRAGLLITASVGEEGQGDLRGVKHLFRENRHRDAIAAFVAIDGLETARLVTGAVGSKRYRVAFRGPGGHSFGAFGLVNPAFALARAADGLSRIQVPAQPKTTYSIGRIGGGTSINAIPEEAWMEVDLRSESAAELARLEEQFLAILPAAVADENAARSTREGSITVEAKPIGDRPAGTTAPDSRIARLAAAVIAARGFAPVLEASSTDSNIPISLGIPAVTVASGCHGDRAHSLEEWIDVDPAVSAPGIATALGVVMAVAGVA
ncbi:M20/M25/M40 family metallo-hydrolase [Roseomonas sp. OT10]|uniref:M20/M25/M40 family metallo-hydrolase n=1 Tax=Roseomonas cutis TaxID=2897332 RepID=UPI001E5D0886|nr:M20/M25/M40 family metallo-hydrolase [Roseomonas sp. OT10]UFN48600.1 M20/M25/M40 family metallo-hydrolase [Roseomonas sp. OT10]